MKISDEEVRRLLAYNPTMRMGSGAAVMTSPEQSADTETVAAQALISTSAQEVQQVKKLVNQLPDIREDRVRALKAQVESGTYHVSSEEIADLIIRRTLADNTAL